MNRELHELLHNCGCKTSTDSCSYITTYGPKANWAIKNDKYQIFWGDYCNIVYNNKKDVNNLCLAEKSSQYLPLTINLSFKFECDDINEGTWEPCGINFLANVVFIYQKILLEHFKLTQPDPENNPEEYLELTVVVAKSPTYWDPETQYLKNEGRLYSMCDLRIQFPYAKIDIDIQNRMIRDKAIKAMRDINILSKMGKRPVGDLNDIVQKLEKNGPYMMYGSTALPNRPAPYIDIKNDWGYIWNTLKNINKKAPETKNLDYVFLLELHNHINTGLITEEDMEVPEEIDQENYCEFLLPLFFSVDYYNRWLMPNKNLYYDSSDFDNQPPEFFGLVYFLNLDFTNSESYKILDKLSSLYYDFYNDIGLFPFLVKTYPYDTTIIKILIHNMYDPLYIDGKGNTPLHYACTLNNNNIQNIELLISYGKNALAIPNKKGLLPIHRATKSNTNINTIKLLYYSYPESIFVENVESLIKISAKYNVNLEILDFFHQIWTEKLILINYNAMLHTAVKYNPNYLVIKYILEYCFASDEPIDFINNKGNTLLHLACKNNNINVVQYLANQFPTDVWHQNNLGDLPLHIAAKYNTSDIVLFLMNIYIEGVMIKNNDEDTVLHCACKNNKQWGNFKIINILYKEYPYAISEKNKNGDLPLHIAARYNKNLKAVELLYNLYTEAITIKNNAGMTVLHLAALQNTNPEVVRLIYEKYPEAITIIDNDGNFSLHLAARCNTSVEVVEFIYNMYQDAIKLKNNDGHLPLHLAAWSNTTVDVVHLIYEKYPGAIKINNNQEDLPLHLAIRQNSNPKVVQFIYEKYV